MVMLFSRYDLCCFVFAFFFCVFCGFGVISNLVSFIRIVVVGW